MNQADQNSVRGRERPARPMPMQQARRGGVAPVWPAKSPFERRLPRFWSKVAQARPSPISAVSITITGWNRSPNEPDEVSAEHSCFATRSFYPQLVFPPLFSNRECLGAIHEAGLVSASHQPRSASRVAAEM